MIRITLLNVFWLKSPSFSFPDKSVSKLRHKERSMISLGYQRPSCANSHLRKHSRVEDQLSSKPITTRQQRRNENTPPDLSRKERPTEKNTNDAPRKAALLGFLYPHKGREKRENQKSLNKASPKGSRNPPPLSYRSAQGAAAQERELPAQEMLRSAPHESLVRSSPLPPGHLPRHEASARPW